MHVSSFKISIFKNKGLDICADLEINFVHLATVAVANAADVWLKMDFCIGI